MLSHCLKCRKNTESRDPKVVRTKNVRIMLLPKCAVCNSNVPVLNDISKVNTLFWKCKINAIIKKPLLAGDQFMPKMNLKQPGFT